VVDRVTEHIFQARSREGSHPDSPSQRMPTQIVVQSAVAIPAAESEEVEEGDSQNSCNSFLDLDPDDTMVSQQTAATEMTQPTQSRARQVRPHPYRDRVLANTVQHAEILRLRLRLAHFKVRTNQIHIPLAQLRISTSESPHSPERQPSLPKLLPAPVLRPTAYSARTVTQSQIPSSPPSSPESNPEKVAREEVFRTPALPRHSTALRQINSPPDSQEGESRETYTEEDNLTSSAVRGKAAIGLLGLRQER